MGQSALSQLSATGVQRAAVRPPVRSGRPCSSGVSGSDGSDHTGQPSKTTGVNATRTSLCKKESEKKLFFHGWITASVPCFSRCPSKVSRCQVSQIGLTDPGHLPSEVGSLGQNTPQQEPSQEGCSSDGCQDPAPRLEKTLRDPLFP